MGRFGDMTVDGFLAGLASKEPTPGGGAAAAIAGATGAALIAMVGRLTLGKPGFEDLEERMRALVERADGRASGVLGAGRPRRRGVRAGHGGVPPAEGDRREKARSGRRRSSAGSSRRRGGAARDRPARRGPDGAGRGRDGDGQSATRRATACRRRACCSPLRSAPVANVEINASSLKDEVAARRCSTRRRASGNAPTSCSSSAARHSAFADRLGLRVGHPGLARPPA